MYWLAVGAIFSLAAALAISAWIIRTQEAHLHLTGDHAGGPQKIHGCAVPRVGGIAIFGALLVGVLLSYLARPYLLVDGLLMLACLLPAFLGGLYEDVSGNVSPGRRYFFTGVSAACFVLAFDVSVSRVLIPGVDHLLAVGAISLLFTCFAIASVAHAMNLIDGQNGLCGGVSFILCTALVWVSIETRQAVVFSLAMLTAAANVGFLLCNHPHGKIFLGDGGAYLNGAMIAVLSVMVVEGSQGAVSPWFPVALLAYPIWETLYSMLRRKLKGRRFMDPDNLHLHSMFGHWDRNAAGCARRARTSAPRLWLTCAIPAVLAAVGYASTAFMVAVFAGFVIAYQLLYWVISALVDGFHKPENVETHL